MMSSLMSFDWTARESAGSRLALSEDIGDSLSANSLKLSSERNRIYAVWKKHQNHILVQLAKKMFLFWLSIS